jgi:hypothetical protein
MSQDALRGEMRATLEAAIQDPPNIEAPTPEQRAEWAERRHMFWRRRSLEHARTIDRQLGRIHELLADVRRLERSQEEAGRIMAALVAKSDCAVDRNAEFAAFSAWKIKARGEAPLVDYSATFEGPT